MTSTLLTALTTPLVLGCLLAAAVIHYLCAAGAARAAAGVALPFGELVGTQLAASAANRLTPAGLGGAAINGRFFHRRGHLDAPQAAAAVSTLALLGGASDVLAFAGVVILGTAFGLAGARQEIPLLVQKISALLPSASGWLVVGSAAALLCVLAIVVIRLRHRHGVQRGIAAAKRFVTSVVATARHPVRLGTLAASSAGTTLVLAAGFAAAAVLGPAALPAATFCALMIGYMVASAAGNALPIPGGIGTTDAALAGVLLAAHAPASAAVATVLAFRVVTFWAPAAAGLLLGRTLHRRGAF